jgi:WD40 repeat protein
MHVKKPNMKYQYLTGLILAILIGAYTQAKNTAEVTNANPAIKASFRDLVAFSSDGNTFASMNSEGQITLWDVTSGLVRTTLPSQFVNPVKRIVFSPDGNTLAIVGDNSIRLWNFISGNIHLFLPGSTAITDMAFSPDGRTLAAVDQDSRIMLWDSQSGSALQVLAGHQDSVNALSLIPILGSHPNSIDALAFSPDGKILATGGQDAWIKLWDTATGQEQASLPSKTHVTDLAFSPDGRILAAVNENESVSLWDVSGKSPQYLAAHKDSVIKAAFSSGQRP